MSTKNIHCYICSKDIDALNEEYYVFLSRTIIENEPYCIKCYERDIEDMKELDPFITPLYAKNFIKMNV